MHKFCFRDPAQKSATKLCGDLCVFGGFGLRRNRRGPGLGGITDGLPQLQLVSAFDCLRPNVVSRRRPDLSQAPVFFLRDTHQREVGHGKKAVAWGVLRKYVLSGCRFGAGFGAVPAFYTRTRAQIPNQQTIQTQYEGLNSRCFSYASTIFSNFDPPPSNGPLHGVRLGLDESVRIFSNGQVLPPEPFFAQG